MKNATRTIKQILSTVLALMMLVAVIPMTVTAANETYSFEGMNSQSTFSIYHTLKNDGSYWVWGNYPAGERAPHQESVSNLKALAGTYRLMQNGEVWQYLDIDSYYYAGQYVEITPIKVMDNVVELRQSQHGKGFACYVALKPDGTLLGWGSASNLTGVHSGEIEDIAPENAITLLTDVKHVETCYNGWMALKNDGSLWSAGYSYKATLSPNSTETTTIEMVEKRKIMDNVAAFSLAHSNALVIKTDKSLWSWGSNNYGQLGNGGTYTYNTVGDRWESKPTKILDDVIFARAGDSAFAVTSDGTLYGWGSNSFSQLGFTGGNFIPEYHTEATFQSVPVKVAENVAMAMGDDWNSVIIKRDGSLWTAGRNEYEGTGHPTSKYPGNVTTFTKLMDGVALPGGTPYSTDTTTETDSPAADQPVAQSTRPVAIFVDDQGRINRFRVQGYRTTNYDTMEITSDTRKIVMYIYSSDYKLSESRNLDIELTYIAGVFPGKDYNYLVFYDYNLEEKSNVEVLRIVKYTKDWVRLGHAGIYGGEIRSYGMGYGGNFSFAEYNGMLYIHTAQSIYKMSDGLNHQTNLTLSIRTSDMVMTDSSHLVAPSNTGYVSHSRGQEVLVDSQGYLVTLDNGDGYPIGASLFRSGKKAGADTYRSTGEAIVIKTWPMGTGEWYTGSATQGLVETRDGYLSAYIDSGMGSKFDSVKHTIQAYVALTPRDNFTAAATKTYAVTSLPAGARETVYSMQLVPVSLDGGYVIVITREQDEQGQNNTYHMYWSKYAADGSVTALKKFSSNAVSDGNVVYTNNQLLWLEYDQTPTTHISQLDNIYHNFYTFDGEKLTYHSKNAASLAALPDFGDVPSTHWAYTYVNKAASNSLVQGVGDGKYEPERNVSGAEWATMLVNLFYKNDTGRSGDYWWSANMDIAGAQRNIFAGTTIAAIGTSSWDAGKVQSGINRYDMAQVIYNIGKEQGWPIPDTSAASSQIGDWSSIPANYRDAVAYCFSAGFVTGVDSKGTFSGASTMTRAQAATVLCRLLDAKNAN